MSIIAPISSILAHVIWSLQPRISYYKVSNQGIRIYEDDETSEISDLKE